METIKLDGVGIIPLLASVVVLVVIIAFVVEEVKERLDPPTRKRGGFSWR